MTIPNDLKKEWSKYPPDYINAVVGLYKVRNETIMRWNKDDHQTHDMIIIEYISNFIKALELGFSPKMTLTRKNRSDWQISIIEKNSFNKIHIPSKLGTYQKIVLKLISHRQYKLMYWLLKLKVTTQNTSLFDPIKRIIKKIDNRCD